MFQIKVSEVILETQDLLLRRDNFGAYYLTVDCTKPEIFNRIFGQSLYPQIAIPFIKQPYGPGLIRAQFVSELQPLDDHGVRGLGSVMSIQDPARKQVTMLVSLCMEHMDRKNWRRERERIQNIRGSFFTDNISQYSFAFYCKDGRDFDSIPREGCIFTAADIGLPPEKIDLTVSYFSNRITAVVEPADVLQLVEALGVEPDVSLDRLNQAVQEPFEKCYRTKKLSQNYLGALDKIFSNFNQMLDNPSERWKYFEDAIDLLGASLDGDALYLYLMDLTMERRKNGQKL